MIASQETAGDKLRAGFLKTIAVATIAAEIASPEVAMMKHAWVRLTARERAILLDALSSIRQSKRSTASEIDALTLKLVQSEPHPSITVGVHGGQVQWALGNPFPIRICDYDGDKEDLPDVDERGQPCRIWFEPTDKRRSQLRDRRR